VVAHINPSLPHQVEHGQVLTYGFKRHGIDLHVTADITAKADIHLISGPWYAYDAWVGKPDVLWLDRTYYGDAHDVVSLGWMRPDGSRNFCNDEKTAGKGDLPTLKPMKKHRRCAVVFGDYGMDHRAQLAYARHKYDSVWYRPHPQDTRPAPCFPLRGSLDDVWKIADVAIGHSSTVLVEAQIEGLFVESTDSRHVVHYTDDRESWLKRLSWAQWSLAEIEQGAFWDHLCLL
jgi:hypothetical protein